MATTVDKASVQAVSRWPSCSSFLRSKTSRPRWDIQWAKCAAMTYASPDGQNAEEQGDLFSSGHGSTTQSCPPTERTNACPGQLKAKLAKLKRELLEPSSGGGGAGVGFDVARTGVASVGFIGFPSVGKSTLMSKLTGQHSEAAAYEFTTACWNILVDLESVLTSPAHYGAGPGPI